MPAYHELVIKGDRKELRAFIEGFMIGSKKRRGYIFTEEHAFDMDRLKDLIKFHGEVTHLICDTANRGLIESGIKKASEKFDFEIVERHRIRRAYFEFDFKTANRKVAGTIKRLIGKMPAGVKVADLEQDEIIDPSARGVELYTPTHHYNFYGKGVVEGDPFGVHHLHAKMREHENINVSDMDIHVDK